MAKNSNQLENIGQALFIVNRHAKTALDPTYLYKIKNEAMQKLLKEKKAVKVGLHFSNNPKRSHQHSVMLVKVGEYYFHMPPTKADMQQLDHLGKLDDSYRNPKPSLSLTKAKQILTSYLNWPKKRQASNPHASLWNKNSLFYYRRKQ